MTPFSLAYREQQQLFENNWGYVADLAAQPGGQHFRKIGRSMIPKGVAAVLVVISAVWSNKVSERILSRTDLAKTIA